MAAETGRVNFFIIVTSGRWAIQQGKPHTQSSLIKIIFSTISQFCFLYTICNCIAIMSGLWLFPLNHSPQIGTIKMRPFTLVKLFFTVWGCT